MSGNPVSKFRIHECLDTHRHTGACFSHTAIDHEIERQLIRLFGIDKDDSLHQLSLTNREPCEVACAVYDLFGAQVRARKARAKKARIKNGWPVEPKRLTFVRLDAYEIPLVVEDSPALKVRERCECVDGETCIVCCTSTDLMAFPEFLTAPRTQIAEDDFHVLVPVEVAEQLGFEWDNK